MVEILKKHYRLASVILVGLLAISSFFTTGSNEVKPQPRFDYSSVPIVAVLEQLSNMSIEQKVGQMFIVTPEVFSEQSAVTDPSHIDFDMVEQYNIGGMIMFSRNLKSPEQITNLNSKLSEYDPSLFIAVDEEGGQVSRISSNTNFPVETFANMSDVYKGDAEIGYEIGDAIGDYLNQYNFNLNFAPVADVYLNSANTVINKRSFSNDPQIVADVSSNVHGGLRNHGIMATAKHFPGHGNTAEDSHYGFAINNANRSKLNKTELVPFQRLISEDIEMVMIGHVIYPKIDKSEVPATLSYEIVTKMLKQDMGYNGVIITDAMNMGAIAEYYSVSDSTVAAINAGNDIILMPEDFDQAYNSVIKAVESGEISEDRINESVIKILILKHQNIEA